MMERSDRFLAGAWLFAMTLGLLVSGCDPEGGTQPETLRFGQIGQVRVTLIVPLDFGKGELQQVLTWNSNGAWRLREAISYRGLPGDETVIFQQGDAGSYAALILQLNETEGLRLRTDELIPDLGEDCPFGSTTVVVSIRDDIKELEESWVRCAQGSLGTLKTSDAGPDPAAVRVIQAAILEREYTQGPDFFSAYFGSVPFGTLDRGEESGAELSGPDHFVGKALGNPATPPGWVQFWRDHRQDPVAVPPPVNWAEEMVLVAAVGERREAGDSVEVRRVLQTGEGTQVTLFERVPGDFCSPAARRHFPVHIVVAPRKALPIEFSEVVTERVPCGS
jgi:hypothetical protein